MAKERQRAPWGDIAPRLAEITDTVLFGEVWRRKGLSPRDRSLITVACLIALYRTNELPFHLRKAIEQRRRARRDRRGDHPSRLLFRLADRQHSHRNPSRDPSRAARGRIERISTCRRVNSARAA